MTLTSKQVDFLKEINNASLLEGGTVWCDCLADELGGQFEGKPSTIGAMISTLKEKGLVDVFRDADRAGKPKYMEFTAIGEEILEGLGL